MKPITPEEAAGIKVNVGDERGTTALVFPPTKNGGQTYTRMMIVWNHNRRIKQHRIYQGTVSSKNLLAQAKVSRFAEYDAGTRGGRRPEMLLARGRHARVDTRSISRWMLQLRDVKVNQFDSSLSAALFVEPVVKGNQRVNLAELSRSQRRDSRTTVQRYAVAAAGPQRSEAWPAEIGPG